MSYTLTGQTGNSPKLLQFVDQLTNPEQVLLPIYEFDEVFSFDFKVYEYDAQTDADVLCKLSLVSYSSIDGFSASNSDANTIRISGRARDVFTSSFYKFLTNENEVKILPSTTSDYMALLEWSPPPQSITTISHSIGVLVEAPSILGYVPNQQAFQIPQNVHWKWQPVLKRFQELVAGGKI